MNRTAAFLSPLLVIAARMLVTCEAATDQPKPSGKLFVPRIASDYVLVYKPQPSVYSGPGTAIISIAAPMGMV